MFVHECTCCQNTLSNSSMIVFFILKWRKVASRKSKNSKGREMKTTTKPQWRKWSLSPRWRWCVQLTNKYKPWTQNRRSKIILETTKNRKWTFLRYKKPHMELIAWENWSCFTDQTFLILWSTTCNSLPACWNKLSTYQHFKGLLVCQLQITRVTYVSSSPPPGPTETIRYFSKKLMILYLVNTVLLEGILNVFKPFL